MTTPETPRALRYYSDDRRHLVCVPYTLGNLARMAADLGLKRCWFHAGRHPHYDIPKRRMEEIAARTIHVTPRAILAICNEGRLL